jgi:chloramphenicol 3-O-phosphotransferase
MAAFPEVPFAMTEWCEMVGGRDAGMDSALTLARTVHSDLTLAGVRAWQYWIAVSRYDYHDGLLYTDYVGPGDEESIQQTQRLWALGNYSRFLRPGARRIGLDLAPTVTSEGTMARIPFVVPEIATGTAAGDRLFRLEDPAGDDHGPGTYTYPGSAVFSPGSFDLLAVEATDGGEDVLFTIRLGAELTDPWNGSPVGYDLQNIDIYVDTRAEGGFTELLPGRRALVADGFAWDRAVFATGRTDVAERDVAEKVPAGMREALFVPLEDRQSIDGDTLTLRVPKEFLGEMRPGWAFQVLVMGSDGSMESDSLRVREVRADASDWSFGGGSDGTEDPNILDLLVPEGMTQAEALAWEPATRIEVHASAFVDEETDRLVIVAINESAQEQAVELEVPHGARSLLLTPYRTAEGEGLAQGRRVPLVRRAEGPLRGEVALAPRSITTFTAPWG